MKQELEKIKTWIEKRIVFAKKQISKSDNAPQKASEGGKIRAFKECLNVINTSLASTPKVDGWISVDERLPEVDPLGIIRVLVSDGYNIDTAMYRYKEFSIGNSSKLINKIIWWQYITPIPDLPNTP